MQCFNDDPEPPGAASVKSLLRYSFLHCLLTAGWCKSKGVGSPTHIIMHSQGRRALLGRFVVCLGRGWHRHWQGGIDGGYC